MPTINELLNRYGEEMVRNQLRKIVEIYDLEWIVAHELIQNAIDAIQANPRIVDEGKVSVLFDFDTDTVSVSDNGTGFQHKLELLCPGGTGAEKRLSSRSSTKGYQGVGLKAVMYSTQRFELESQTRASHWTFISEDLNKFIEPDGKHVPEYVEEVVKQGAEETWTTVTAGFPAGTLTRFLNSRGS